MSVDGVRGTGQQAAQQGVRFTGTPAHSESPAGAPIVDQHVAGPVSEGVARPTTVVAGEAPAAKSGAFTKTAATVGLAVMAAAGGVMPTIASAATPQVQVHVDNAQAHMGGFGAGRGGFQQQRPVAQRPVEQRPIEQRPVETGPIGRTPIGVGGHPIGRPIGEPIGRPVFPRPGGPVHTVPINPGFNGAGFHRGEPFRVGGFHHDGPWGYQTPFGFYLGVDLGLLYGGGWDWQYPVEVVSPQTGWDCGVLAPPAGGFTSQQQVQLAVLSNMANPQQDPSQPPDPLAGLYVDNGTGQFDPNNPQPNQRASAPFAWNTLAKGGNVYFHPPNGGMELMQGLGDLQAYVATPSAQQ